MFLKAWIPVTVPQLYNPVTSLLLPVGGKDVWKGMKTVGELKRERDIQNTVNADHLYRVHVFIFYNFVSCCQEAFSVITGVS